VRVLAVDPLDQTITYELRAEKWRDGELVTDETHTLTDRMYFRDELLLLLEQAGFADIEVRGGYADEPPAADHDFLVYVARKSVDRP
jgi:hypothetical protein